MDGNTLEPLIKKQLLLLILIATVTTLPWIGLGDFYTKGEPREAVLAISIIEKGEWIIPTCYADELAYKPPLTAWLVSAFSLAFNDGVVSPFTARLPSTLAFIGIIVISFLFFARRRPTLEAFIACLILITSFEIHRSAVTARIDMLFTFLLVASIIQLYLWHEKRKIKQLLSVWILISAATLVKGPVAIVIPPIIFGAYLLSQRVNFFKAVLLCVMVVLPALLLPAIWYYQAYMIAGDRFLEKTFAENLGRFLSINTEKLNIDYHLGVENPWWYYPRSLIFGFLPWTILVIISIFFLNFTKVYWLWKISKERLKSNIQNMLRKENSIMVYCFLIIVLSLIFFTIPSSKRSVYIMLTYPFISLYLAQYFIYLSKKKPKAIYINTGVLMGVSIIVLLVSGLLLLDLLNIEKIIGATIKRERTAHDILVLVDRIKNINLLGTISLQLLLLTILLSIRYIRKKASLKALGSGFAIIIALNLVLDSCLLPALKNSYSAQPFAHSIKSMYDLNNTNVYVTNHLLRYDNMYGMNFYMGNIFRNIKMADITEGYFIGNTKDIDKVTEDYGSLYDFTLLEKSDIYNDSKLEILLFRIDKKNNKIGKVQ